MKRTKKLFCRGLKQNKFDYLQQFYFFCYRHEKIKNDCLYLQHYNCVGSIYVTKR